MGDSGFWGDYNVLLDGKRFIYEGPVEYTQTTYLLEFDTPAKIICCPPLLVDVYTTKYQQP